MMAIEQTVEIPASRRLTIDVPPEVPEGQVILRFIPAVQPEIPQRNYTSLEKVEAALARQDSAGVMDALKKAHGAWKDNPWRNCVADIRAMRDSWVNPWDEQNV